MAGPVNIQTLTYPPPPSALPPSTPSNSTPHCTVEADLSPPRLSLHISELHLYD